MPPDITPLRPEDLPRWTALWRDYLAFYKTSLPDETYETTWARLLDGTALHGLAARREGRIIGITHFLFHGTAWSSRPLCYLQDLFVEEAARGAGAASALIEAVAARARARESLRLYWMTQADNTVARSLYDRVARHNGFVRYDYALD